MSDAKQTILIVEDHGDLRRLFCLALQLEGFRVLEAADGYDALLKLDTHYVDLVVLDLYLPRIAGFVVHQEIRGRAAYAHTPIVIVTSSSEDLSHLHVACVLRKPILASRLVEKIRECLRHSMKDPRR